MEHGGAYYDSRGCVNGVALIPTQLNQEGLCLANHAGVLQACAKQGKNGDEAMGRESMALHDTNSTQRKLHLMR